MNRFQSIAVFAAAVVAACVVHSGTGTGVTKNDVHDHRTDHPDLTGGGPAFHVETVTDDSGKTYQISQGVKGEPALVGCADGQREAFVDTATFPAIAGCMGSWEGTESLRAEASGTACGDDGATCNAPSDVCAPGWHVCGASGAVSELRAITADECANAGGGRFSAAISHCEAQENCVYDQTANANYPCFASGWCSEPVCCGADCGEFGVCTDGVWPGGTHIPVGEDQGCAAMHADRAGGILCCKG
jgi:hypothetical protein